MCQKSKALFTAIILCMFVAPISVFAQGSISIDNVDGLLNGKVAPGQSVQFNIRWTNNTGSSIRGGGPGYRVFLRNNTELPAGQFDPIVADTLPIGLGDLFDLGFFISHFSADGIGSDTAVLSGAVIMGPGIADGFDGLIGHITTAVSSEYAGDSLCIDSASFAQNPWKWNTTSGDVVPDWSGPHCFEILSSCCVGTVGNANNSPDDAVDISDLQYLVDFVFVGGPAPVCLEEANFVSAGIDVADVVFIVEYIFLQGPQPPACP